MAPACHSRKRKGKIAQQIWLFKFINGEIVVTREGKKERMYDESMLY